MPVLFAQVTRLAFALCLLLVSLAGLAQPLAIALDTAITPHCAGWSDGKIFVTVSGGTPPYQYQWSNGDTTEDITGLSAIAYTLVVTDLVGQTSSLTATVPNDPLRIALTPGHLSPNGYWCVPMVFISPIEGGQGLFMPLTCQRDNNPPVIATIPTVWPFGAQAFCFGSSSCTFTVTVTDSLGCTITSTETDDAPAPPVITAMQITDACAGTTSGSIAPVVQGGTPPYLFQWSGNGVSSQDSIFTGLPAGQYNLTIRDDGWCEVDSSFTIQSLPTPDATFTSALINGSFVSFASTSPTAGAYTWDFGDPASGAANASTLQQPTHGFTQPGTYQTQFKMTNIHGCVDSSSQNITIAATIQGRIFRGGNPPLPTNSARVWLLRQSTPGGPFAVVDSQDISTSNYIFSFPVNFSYQDSLTLYAALLPQDLGFGQWEPAYYGNTPLLATATRVQTTSLTSLANIFLSTKVPVEPAAGALAATLSPNPFVHTLSVRLLASLSDWTATLYAADGRQVLAHACAGEHATLNVAHLPAGVYLLRVSGGGKEAAFRVVKEE